MTHARRTVGFVAMLAGMILTAGGSVGCKAMNGAEGSSPDQQRDTIQAEAKKTLEDLYAAKPETREKVAKAVGYGYFSNMNVNLLVMSTENGYGMVRNNQTGKDTYMKMGGAGVGLGAGVKDYRAIFIFTDPAVLAQFVEKGFDASGSADAAAKGGGEGGAASVGAKVAPGLEVYQFTQKGLALQATIQGTKYWKDDKLNEK
ncbi:MAG: YSC84-related protein [Phycisphaerae bacterium]|nr:YSC84-related protein [Tepidisphaeraceae bacterium]